MSCGQASQAYAALRPAPWTQLLPCCCVQPQSQDAAVLCRAALMQVYQRQMMKSDLADATMQGGGGVNRLSHDELKQLFHLDMGPECSTRKLLESSKAGSNVLWLQLGAAGSSSSSSSSASLPPALARAVATGVVTAVNRERQQQQGVEDGVEEATAVGEVGSAATLEAAAGTGAAGKCDDVSALELEDW